MRRRMLVLVLLLLVGGAIINVTVAWGFNLKYVGGKGFEFAPDAASEPVRWWIANAPAGFAARPAAGYSQRNLGRESVLLAEHIASTTSPTLGNNVARYRYGWPCRSLERANWVDRKARIVLHHHQMPVPDWWPWENRPLSTGPVWPGFAINTVFYGVVLWLGFAAASALRRRLRIRRGVCPKCAYPVGSSEICTECGNALTRSH